MATAIDLTRLPTTASQHEHEHVGFELAAGLPAGGFGDRIGEVMQIIDARLGCGDVRIDATAAALGISARTLQRNLDASGTSYREVLAHTRRRRRAELRTAGLRETEVARKLGFCDARAMRRSLDGTE